MGENEKEFVLQWDGHAGYVTERFSGLLARQSLVDVTLICEEQKLRVHKLVLASCSLYFEEMLEQDLGQEPIIVLKDLNFEVLKAMVEFMYCGETTISQKYLPSLLIAARLFKVNELEFIAKQISESQDFTEDGSSSDKVFEEDSEDSEYTNKVVDIDSDCEEIIPDTQNNNEVDCYDIKDMSDSESEKGPSVECCSEGNDSEQELEHTLYEELTIKNKSRSVSEPQHLSSSNSCRVNGSSVDDEMNRISKLLQRDKSLELFDNESVIDCNDSDAPGSKAMLYDQCCDFSNDDSRKSPSSPRQQEETDERYSSDSTEVGSKVGQCLKVYTHKKRKSINKIRNHLLQINELLPELPTTKSIDLLNDSSGDETSLNIENSEYVSSLTSENIQSIVGCTLNEFNLVDSDSEINVCNGYLNDKDYVLDSHKEIRKVEFFTEFENDRRTKPPILRRSVRLSQQESEESTEDNLFLTKSQKHKIRIVDRDRSANKVNIFPKRKRKRHSEQRAQDIASPTQSNTKRSLRKTTKLGKYKTKTRLSLKLEKEKSKDIEKAKDEKAKDEKTRDEKTKDEKSRDEKSKDEKSRDEKSKDEKLKEEKWKDAEKEETERKAVPLNTIATVNRALWGDMTDVSQEYSPRDFQESSKDSTECSPSMEIPFAVGLLPLRAALEKMQAMPDYQPRKTRSSVAPVKQDSINFKRKNNHLEVASGSKKHFSSESMIKENAKTVCHIEIRTASQCARNRKRSLSDSVEPTAIADRQ